MGPCSIVRLLALLGFAKYTSATKARASPTAYNEDAVEYAPTFQGNQQQQYTSMMQQPMQAAYQQPMQAVYQQPVQNAEQYQMRMPNGGEQFVQYDSQQMTQPQGYSGQQASFLAPASPGDEAVVLNQLTQAVAEQSQALTALERQQSKLMQAQSDYSEKSLELFSRLAGAPQCSSYSKNGIGPVETRSDCKDACKTAEGLSRKSCGLENFKGEKGKAKCSCCTKCSIGSCNSYRSVCKDDDYSASHPTHLMSTAVLALMFLGQAYM